MMHEFWENDAIPRGGNSSFIALIPKRDNAQELVEFRPISLIGCVYKIISKVFAKRMEMVLEKIIDDKQSAIVGWVGGETHA